MAFTYLFLRFLHIVAVISWMAGLLYLYRLYVNHHGETEAIVMERLRGMERRLWYAITVPAAWVAVLSGLGIIVLLPCVFLPNGWLTVKLLLAVGMLTIHFMAGSYRKAFLRPPFPHRAVTFRVLNEVPTLLMIGIVLLVVFKPGWWVWPICE